MMRYALLTTPMGCVGFAATQRGLCRVLLLEGPADAAARRMATCCPGATRDQSLLPDLQADLARYFTGRPSEFSATLDLSGVTPFRRRVLDACARVGYGETITYGELARRVGCPNGARAVGGAMANNPVPIVVPCHRVVAGSGRLGGFSAEQGVSLKKRLLEMESLAARSARTGPSAIAV